MDTIAYLTRYDALLCKDCALNTDDLVGNGTRWLNGLTALPITEAVAIWPEACCEECDKPFALSASWSR